MLWLPCLLPFALIYKVLEYIYKYFFGKKEEDKEPACPISGKAAEEGASCPFVAAPTKKEVQVEDETTENHEKVAWTGSKNYKEIFCCAAALVSDVL